MAERSSWTPDDCFEFSLRAPAEEHEGEMLRAADISGLAGDLPELKATLALRSKD